MGKLMRPICGIVGHDTYLDDHHSLIACRRCNRDTTRSNWLQRLPSRTGRMLVWLANRIDHDWFGVDFGNYQRINNIEFIARNHLQSLVNQGDDMLLSDYLSDKGWVKLSDMKHDDGTPYTAQEQADMISKSLTLEATRQEQEELNKYDG